VRWAGDDTWRHFEIEERRCSLPEVETGSGANKWHGSLPYKGAHPVDKACSRYGDGAWACAVGATASTNGALAEWPSMGGVDLGRMRSGGRCCPHTACPRESRGAQREQPTTLHDGGRGRAGMRG
jgi:hypothetical protein